MAKRLTVLDLVEFSEVAAQAVAASSSISIDARDVSQIDALGLQALASLSKLASLQERDCEIVIEPSGAIDEALVKLGFRQPDAALPPPPYIYREVAA